MSQLSDGWSRRLAGAVLVRQMRLRLALACPAPPVWRCAMKSWKNVSKEAKRCHPRNCHLAGIGAALKEARRKMPSLPDGRTFSQDQLAAEANISRAHLSRIECGQSKVTITDQRQLVLPVGDN